VEYNKTITFALLNLFLGNGLVVQLVRMPPCHGGGRGFESRPVRFGLVSAVVATTKLAPIAGDKMLRRQF
jgi:hypothetical protein